MPSRIREFSCPKAIVRRGALCEATDKHAPACHRFLCGFNGPVRIRVVEVQRESAQETEFNMFLDAPVEIADEERTPAVDVLLRSGNLPWNCLGRILRMDEQRSVCQMLLNWDEPIPESVFAVLINPGRIQESVSRTIG